MHVSEAESEDPDKRRKWTHLDLGGALLVPGNPDLGPLGREEVHGFQPGWRCGGGPSRGGLHEGSRVDWARGWRSPVGVAVERERFSSLRS